MILSAPPHAVCGFNGWRCGSIRARSFCFHGRGHVGASRRQITSSLDILSLLPLLEQQ
jgi:hypothetical protein